MKRWIDKYRDKKELFIQNHSRICKLRNGVLWFQFHLFRGKNFFTSYIDFIKYWFYAVLGLASFNILGISIGLDYSTALLISGVAILIAMVFFIVWSQVMDFLKWTEAESEFGNERNWFQIEVRDLLRKEKEGKK